MKKALFGVAVCALAAFACSSTNTDSVGEGTDGITKCSDGSTSCDTHCGGKVQTVDPAVCHDPETGDGDADAGDTGGQSDFGATMDGSEGDDDDCKYHVKWSAAGVAENVNVTFHVSAVIKSTSAPLTGAEPYIEAFLDSAHPAPNTPVHTTDNGDGSYDIGPVQFNKAGLWTVRFHFYGDCTDGNEESQHGHAAFFVTVP